MAASDDYYNVAALDAAFAFRATLARSTDARQFWFEVEFPLYPTRVKWGHTEAGFEFSAPQRPWGDLRTKWRDQQGDTARLRSSEHRRPPTVLVFVTNERKVVRKCGFSLH